MKNTDLFANCRQAELPPGFRQRLGRNQITEIAFSLDCRRLAAGSDRDIRIYDLETGVQFAMLVGHADRVRALAFAPDNCVLASASDDNTLRLWDTNTARETYMLTGDSHLTYALASSPDGIPLPAWDESRKHLLPLTGASRVRALAFGPDGAMLASASADGKVQLWELETGELNYTLAAHDGLALALAFTAARTAPHKCRLVTGGSDTFIRLWDLEQKNLLSTLKGHTDSVHTVAVSAISGTIASAGKDRSIRLWDLDTGKLLATQAARDIWKLTFSTDGEQLICVSRAGKIFCWNSD